MRVTQGTFSFLPDLNDAQIRAQVEYALKHRWAVSIEYTDDPHPRNTYWEMYGAPMFDFKDPARILQELDACRAAFPNHYIKVNAFDSTHGWESLRLSFIVNRPQHDACFSLTREEAAGRNIRYTVHPYATERAAGKR